MAKVFKNKVFIICLVFLLIITFSFVSFNGTVNVVYAETEAEVVKETPQPSTPEDEETADEKQNFIVEGISHVFLLITVKLAGLIDLIIGLFKQLVGLENVYIGGEMQSLMDFFLTLGSIKNIFFICTGIGVLLLLVFTIIQMVKGMKNSEDEKLHPKKTFENFMKAVANILLVPAVLIAFMATTNTIMGEVNKAMASGSYGTADVKLSYGGQVLMLMATEKQDKLRLLDVPEWEEYEKRDPGEYFSSSGQPLATAEEMGENSIVKAGNRSYPNFKYMNMDNWTVEEKSIIGTIIKEEGCYYIPYARLNIFVGFAGTVALLVVLIMCSFTFVKRLFDIILLYIVSPLVMSTQPIDEGKRFSAWRDMLISKVLSAYAVIITLNLYFMIIPIVTINPGVTFFGGMQNSIANGTVQLLFVIGGAFALNGSNLLISQLLGTGTMEHQQNMGTMMAMQNMVRAGAGLVAGGFKMAKRLGGGAIKHGIGAAMGGKGYIQRTVNGSKAAEKFKAYRDRIKGPSSLENASTSGGAASGGKGSTSSGGNSIDSTSKVPTSGASSGNGGANGSGNSPHSTSNELTSGTTSGGNGSAKPSENVARSMGKVASGDLNGKLASSPESLKRNFTKLKLESQKANESKNLSKGDKK